MGQIGLNVDLGTFTQFAVSARIIETTAAAKDRFTPQQRGCFFNDEISMQHCNDEVGCRSVLRQVSDGGKSLLIND